MWQKPVPATASNTVRAILHVVLPLLRRLRSRELEKSVTRGRMANLIEEGSSKDAPTREAGIDEHRRDSESGLSEPPQVPEECRIGGCGLARGPRILGACFSILARPRGNEACWSLEEPVQHHGEAEHLR